jgi:thiol-disulfide isomerase/thioredoxin
MQLHSSVEIPMNAALLALVVLPWTVQLQARVVPESTIRVSDVRAKAPLLLGETTAQAILANRSKFRDNLAKVALSEDLRARWKAVRRPLVLVAVFGSWCGDSHRQLPALLALAAEPNAFIQVHYLGVARDMALKTSDWPTGCPPQKVVRVPTFYLFDVQPGRQPRLLATVVEKPPRAGQTMAEALVQLLEAGAKPPDT